MIATNEGRREKANKSSIRKIPAHTASSPPANLRSSQHTKRTAQLPTTQVPQILANLDIRVGDVSPKYQGKTKDIRKIRIVKAVRIESIVTSTCRTNSFYRIFSETLQIKALRQGRDDKDLENCKYFSAGIRHKVARICRQGTLGTSGQPASHSLLTNCSSRSYREYTTFA